MSTSDKDLEELVHRKLAEQFKEALAQNISKHMKVTNTYNPMTDTRTYSGSLTSGSLTTAPFNGTSSTSYVQKIEDLRVVEFTKAGKVTRVELQRKTEHGWKKIPRIQIEE